MIKNKKLNNWLTVKIRLLAQATGFIIGVVKLVNSALQSKICILWQQLLSQKLLRRYTSRIVAIVGNICSKNKLSIILIITILITSLGFGLINLNYNSPFNDEAIYIILGRMGIFQWDWWSYNSLAWMAGLPYIYPVITGIAYMSGGNYK